MTSPTSGMRFEPGQAIPIGFRFGNGFSPATVIVLSRIGTQNPGTALTADLQIIDPVRENVDTTLVGGLRMKIDF